MEIITSQIPWCGFKMKGPYMYRFIKPTYAPINKKLMFYLTDVTLIKGTKLTYPANISTGNGQFLIKGTPFTVLYQRVFLFLLHDLLYLREIIWSPALYKV